MNGVELAVAAIVRIEVETVQAVAVARCDEKTRKDARMAFAAIEIEYKVQNVDGSLGAGSKVKYNLKQMQAA